MNKIRSNKFFLVSVLITFTGMMFPWVEIADGSIIGVQTMYGGIISFLLLINLLAFFFVRKYQVFVWIVAIIVGCLPFAIILPTLSGLHDLISDPIVGSFIKYGIGLYITGLGSMGIIIAGIIKLKQNPHKELISHPRFKYSAFAVLLIIIGLIAFKLIFPAQTSEVYSGESETWEVVDVKINTNKQDKLFNMHKGKLYMKGETEFLADYFKLSTHIALNKDEDERESKKDEYELEADNLPDYEDDDVMDITEKDTGMIAMTWLTDSWKPVTISDIEQVYIIVEWKGEHDNNLKREKVILKPNKTN